VAVLTRIFALEEAGEMQTQEKTMTEDQSKKRKRKHIAEDGEVVRRPLTLMDAATRDLAATVDRILRPQLPLMHRPGFVQLSDAEKTARERLYRNHDQKLTERWRRPTQLADHSDTVQAAGDERLNAYQRYQQRVSNAWRHR
jgi:hypothetical protein